MNSVFREYVTAGAFQLSLTRNMVETLSCLYVGKRNLSSYGPTSMNSLERRGLATGLVTMIGEDGVKELARKEGWTHSGEWLMVQPRQRLWWLTRAGELTVDLLKEAGLIDYNLQPCKKIVDPHRVKSKKWIQEHTFKTWAEAFQHEE